MDVEPIEGFARPRRHMRRPVAGALPVAGGLPSLPYQDPLEHSWDARQIPGWVYFLVGMFGGGLALVAATGTVLAYWIDRVLRGA